MVGNLSYVLNWVKSFFIFGVTSFAVFVVFVIVFRYIFFFLRLNFSLKNLEKGESFEIDKNDVVGELNYEIFVFC